MLDLWLIKMGNRPAAGTSLAFVQVCFSHERVRLTCASISAVGLCHLARDPEGADLLGKLPRDIETALSRECIRPASVPLAKAQNDLLWTPTKPSFEAGLAETVGRRLRVCIGGARNDYCPSKASISIFAPMQPGVNASRKSSRRRSCVDHVRCTFAISERRAWRVSGQRHSKQRKLSKGRADEERSIADMTDLARQFGRYGYRRIEALLRDVSWRANDRCVKRRWPR